MPGNKSDTRSLRPRSVFPHWKFIIDYNYSNYPVPTTQEPFLERYNTTDITDHLVNGSLFDLAADPNERTDLANAHPELAATMRKKLMEHYAGSTECYMCPPAGMKALWLSTSISSPPRFMPVHRASIT